MYLPDGFHTAASGLFPTRAELLAETVCDPAERVDPAYGRNANLAMRWDEPAARMARLMADARIRLDDEAFVAAGRPDLFSDAGPELSQDLPARVAA